MIGPSGRLVRSRVTLGRSLEPGVLSEKDNVKGQALKPDHAHDLHADVCHVMQMTWVPMVT